MAAESDLPPPDERALDPSELRMHRPEGQATIGFRRARARAALFGSSPELDVGRFRVIERLGAGGMGVVYAAYDPELARAVALKLIPVPARGREAALAEAKALARLSHPNVVPVHDVGVHENHVFIVMEIVRGQTLREWTAAQPRPWREILAMYAQAGAGLAAAHAAGLVHRDFKPDNAIVGADRRVRVLDFGLATAVEEAGEASPASTAVAGTPGYMPPEQAGGAGPITPATDQYSFCVSLREALGAAGAEERQPQPIARFLQAVLARGTAPDPAARFPSMAELLAALERDPSRTARRRALFAVLAGVAVAVFTAGRISTSNREEVCELGGEELGSTWPAAGRQKDVARLGRLGGYGPALAGHLMPLLDRYEARWASIYRDACLAGKRRLQSPDLVDRRMACLDRTRTSLAFLRELVTDADRASLPGIGLAAQALPAPEACSNIDHLLAPIEPPRPEVARQVTEVKGLIAQASMATAAGQYDRARITGGQAVSRARGLDYSPVLARALLVQGHATMNHRTDLSQALPLLAEAARVAVKVGDNDTAVEAWARGAWVRGRTDPGAALAGFDLVEAMAARPTADLFPRALLRNTVGNVELAAGRPEHALVAFRQALADARRVRGPGAVEMVNVRTNVALATADWVERDRLLAEAEQTSTSLLGSEHPQTLQQRLVRFLSADRLPVLAGGLPPTCDALAKHPPLAADAAECWSELGFVRHELGDAAGAVTALRQATAIGGASSSSAPEARAYLALWSGQSRRGRQLFEQAIASRPDPKDLQVSWYARYQSACLHLGVGRAERALGNRAAARRPLEIAMEVLGELERTQRFRAIPRRATRARAELAWALPEGPQRRRLAAAAAVWLRANQGRAEEVSQLERLAAGDSTTVGLSGRISAGHR